MLPELDPGVRVAPESVQRAEGVPSAVVGSMVQAVKSTPIPMTDAGSTPDSCSRLGMATRSAST